MNVMKGSDVSKIHPEIDRRLSVIDTVLRENGVVPEFSNLNRWDFPGWVPGTDLFVSWDGFCEDKGRAVWKSLKLNLSSRFDVFVEVDFISVHYDLCPSVFLVS